MQWLTLLVLFAVGHRLGGFLRDLAAPLSKPYRGVEWLNGILFAAVYWLELPHGFGTEAIASSAYCPIGPQICDGLPDAVWLHLRYAVHILMAESLIVASLADWDHWTIPAYATDPTILATIALSAVGQLWLAPLDPTWAVSHPHWHGLAVSLAGLVAGGGVMWSIRLISYSALRQESLGFGDVMIMAMVGAVVGWQAVLVSITLGAFLAVAFRGSGYVPFGPYLSLASLLVAVLWSHVWSVTGPMFSGAFVPLLTLCGLVLLYPTLLIARGVRVMLGVPVPRPPFDDAERD